MNDFLKALMPTAATLLGGPLVGFATKFISDKLGVPAEGDLAGVLANLGTTPEGKIRLAEIDADLKKHAADNGIKLEELAVQNAGQVNTTMQAEAASEHWPSYSWRPAIGFAVALAVVLSVLTVFLAYGAAIIVGKPEGLQHLPGILAAVAGIIGVVSPILGIASWFRGRMQADPNVPTVNRG